MMKNKLPMILGLIVCLTVVISTYYFNSIQVPKHFKVVKGINEYNMGWGEKFTSSIPLVYKGNLYMQLHDINQFTMLDCEYDADMNTVRVKNVQMKYGYRVQKQTFRYLIVNEERGRDIKEQIRSDLKINDVKIISELNSTFIKNVEEELDLVGLTTNNEVYLPIREVCDLVDIEMSWNRFKNELEIFVDESETIPPKGVITFDTN